MDFKFTLANRSHIGSSNTEYQQGLCHTRCTKKYLKESIGTSNIPKRYLFIVGIGRKPEPSQYSATARSFGSTNKAIFEEIRCIA